MRPFLVLLAFLFLTAESPPPWGIEELVGKKAQYFTLKDMNDKDVSLASLKGKVVLINFWATWCPPCREEMPSLNRLYRSHRNQGLVVLAIATDRSANDVKTFLGKHPVDFPVLADSDLKAAKQYRVFSMPTTFLIGKDGVLIKRYLGEEEWDSLEIRKEVEKALGSGK